MPTPPPVREFVRLAKAKSTLVKELSADEAEAHLDDLAGILADAVESGASVSFLLPFTLEMGQAFWRKVIAAVRENAAVLLGAYSHGELVGTVQLRLDTPANQQHRGEIVKLLVHRRARGQGIGRALLQALEKSARKRGRVLLVLDTHEGSPASKLYRSQGFVCAGTVPGYAQLPLGGFGDTSVYFKDLRSKKATSTSPRPSSKVRLKAPKPRKKPRAT
jgi:ribosomal protein S18 acetylase RimI-like enzyme